MTSARRRLLALLEIATVGFPFCAFKILFGGVLTQVPGWAVAGWAMTALGVVDTLLNAVGFVTKAAGGESRFGVCSFQQLVVVLRSDHDTWRELGLSLDAMVSFTVVALMIALHLLPRLSPGGLAVWNASVVCNVLGAGAGRLAASLQALRGREGRSA
jgi:hypothetical protein